jgi:hypothetical protein
MGSYLESIDRLLVEFPDKNEVNCICKWIQQSLATVPNYKLLVSKTQMGAMNSMSDDISLMLKCAMYGCMQCNFTYKSDN